MPVGHEALYGRTDFRYIAGIDEQPVLQLRKDVLWASDLGRYNRKPMRRGFHQRQALRLREGRIDENPACSCRERVKSLHVITRMRLWIGDATVEIVPVDARDQFALDLLLFFAPAF